MAKLPEFDPTSYLLERKFPGAASILATLKSGRGVPISLANPEKLNSIKAYEAELREKSESELDKLVKAEKQAQAIELKEKAEIEEKGRFFNQPYAQADNDHWSKAAYWTLDEATALSIGKAPEVVNWKRVEKHQYVSSFAKRYARLRDLASRAKAMKQLYDPVTPGLYLAWAKRNEIPYPPDLEKAVVARGNQIQDWKTLYDELKQQSEEIKSNDERDIVSLLERVEELQQKLDQLETDPKPQSSEDKPLSTKERETLLKLIIGMAVEQYGYDPLAERNEATKNIADDLAVQGIPLDPDTVRKWLKAAAELHPPETE